MPKTTERQMLDALWTRLSQKTAGGPPRSVMAEHVRYDPAWGHSIADALSIDTWRDGGKGHCLHGYEVKVSRSDFLRELNGPEHKWFTWAQHCRYWWIVVPDINIALGKGAAKWLPYGWGLLVLHGRYLRQIIRAERRPEPAPLPWAATAGLMRAAATTAAYHNLTPAERLALGRQTPQTQNPPLPDRYDANSIRPTYTMTSLEDMRP